MKQNKDSYSIKECLRLIEEFDESLDMLNEKWAEEVAEFLEKSKYKEGSVQEEKGINKINDKFKKVIAEVIDTRDEIFEYAYKLQEKEFDEEVLDIPDPDFSKVDENGRPVGYIRVHGKWQKRKKKQN